MPPKDTTILNICVIPSPEVGERCVELSRSMGSDGTMFVLGGDKFAHMTVYMARFPNAAIESVVRAVEEGLKAAKSFCCEHTGYFLTAGRYVEVSYRKSPEFMDLHERMIAAVKDLRDAPGQPHEEAYFTPYNAAQQKNAAETGYDLGRELYRPHVTLTRYFEGKVPELFPAFPQLALSFDLSTIGVYKADDNGAVYEKLAGFIV